LSYTRYLNNILMTKIKFDQKNKGRISNNDTAFMVTDEWTDTIGLEVDTLMDIDIEGSKMTRIAEAFDQQSKMTGFMTAVIDLPHGHHTY
jgi:hypothetical protein